MTTLFIVCFVAGLGLSVVSFVSGLHHHHLHLPRFIRHHGGVKKGGSMINAAAMTAFLTWFGGGGLLLEKLTTFATGFVAGAAAMLGLCGGALINSVINTLARRESLAESLSMIGVIGRAVIPIRAGDGTGEIVFTHAGTRRVAAARSDSGRAVNKGTEVVVTRYEKGIAYVATWQELEEQPCGEKL
jgi:hypothetical protein